ncbi:UNVERIFIED_CONTAM: hypothetical protein FKN15_075867 [Acipenser sinensis]
MPAADGDSAGEEEDGSAGSDEDGWEDGLSDTSQLSDITASQRGKLYSLTEISDFLEKTKGLEIWRRAETHKEVHIYANGKHWLANQLPQYVNRTSLSDSVLQRGDASLLLRRDTKKDAGKYQCEVTTCNKIGLELIELVLVPAEPTTPPAVLKGRLHWFVLVPVVLGVIAICVGLALCKKHAACCWKPSNALTASYSLTQTGSVRDQDSAAQTLRAQGSAAQTLRAQDSAAQTLRAQGSAAQTLRAQDSAAQTLRDQDSAAQTLRDQDSAAQTLRDQDSAAQTLRDQDSAAQTLRDQDSAAQTLRDQDSAAQTLRAQDSAAQTPDAVFIRQDGVQEEAGLPCYPGYWDAVNPHAGCLQCQCQDQLEDLLPHYVNRTRLSDCELQRGDASLLLRRVTEKDAGLSVLFM